MSHLQTIYRTPLALLTDLYQLTMAYGYWKAGIAERQSVFHLLFRANAFGGGYSVACGLEQAIEYVQNFTLEQEDKAYLAGLRDVDDKPLFEPAFLDYLQQLRFTCDIDAVPEGTVVFPQEPLIRVKGPLLQGQLLETPLLNLINFQTLIATKAARIKQAARGRPVIEFGLRRAQGPDGSLSAARAAFIGGTDATSNLLAGRIFGIPVKGTHAHSWVMAFGDEAGSFRAFAEAMPGNTVFLVDTYNTLDGVRHAIQVGLELRQQGKKLLGIRLDSGDLAYLSQEARRLLDEAGLNDTYIIASNDLDEYTITSLNEQGAPIGVWGVGTQLVTAFGQPALGGVYKLGALHTAEGAWEEKIKLSDQSIKTSIPGILQVRRFSNNTGFWRDMIFSELHGEPLPDSTMLDPVDFTKRVTLPHNAPYEDLLVPVFRQGQRVYQNPSLVAIRERTQLQLAKLPAGIKRLAHPHLYPVGLEQRLFEQRAAMILSLRGFNSTPSTLQRVPK